jgi:hypothetical protein
MELARRAVNVERALGAAAVAAALAAAWGQSGAPLERRAREGRPWLAWVEARERGAAAPEFLLAAYDSASRRLSLLDVPPETKLEPRRSVERAYIEALTAADDDSAAARASEGLIEARLRALSPEPIPAVDGRLGVELPPLGDGDEAAVEAAAALKSAARSPRAWARALSAAAAGLCRGDRASLDAVLFDLELRRVPLERIEAARLPDDAQAPALLARLFAAEPAPTDGRGVTAEVLNGSAETGLARRAEKMLRWRGIDVLATGAGRPRARTLVYDRVGDFRRAALVRAALACPSARAVTRVDPARAVDVSVELGTDCAAALGPGDAPQP